MFNGEEFTRIRTTMPFAKVCEQVEAALDRLGRVTVDESGRIDIDRPRITAALSDLTFSGSVKEGREAGDYDVRVRYQIVPNVAALDHRHCAVAGRIGRSHPPAAARQEPARHGAPRRVR